MLGNEIAEERIDEYLVGNSVEVVHLLRPDLVGQPVHVEGHEMQRSRIGNPYSEFWRGAIYFKIGTSDSLSPKEQVDFYVESMPPEMADEADFKLDAYGLFERSRMTPPAHRLRGLPRAILMPCIGELTLEQKLAGLSRDERIKLHLLAGKALSNLHSYAVGLISSAICEDRLLDKIRSRSQASSLKKMIESFEIVAYGGQSQPRIEDSAIVDFTHLYGPIADATDNNQNQLIHGDAGGQNIVGPAAPISWQSENIKFVDLGGLRLGHPMFDLANLTITHNMRLFPADWDAGIEQYQKEVGEKAYLAPNKGIFGRRTAIEPQDALRRKNHTLFYASVVKNALRRMGLMGKLRSEAPDKFGVWTAERPYLANADNEMGITIGLALDYVVNCSNRFLWDEISLNKLGKLKDLLSKYRVIPGGSEEDRHSRREVLATAATAGSIFSLLFRGK